MEQLSIDSRMQFVRGRLGKATRTPTTTEPSLHFPFCFSSGISWPGLKHKLKFRTVHQVCKIELWEKSSIMVSGAGKGTTVGHKEWGKSKLSFLFFHSLPHQSIGRSIVAMDVGWQWRPGRHLKLWEENSGPKSKGASPLLFSLYILLLLGSTVVAFSGSTQQSRKLKPTPFSS